jgi:hypothetical protein
MSDGWSWRGSLNREEGFVSGTLTERREDLKIDETRKSLWWMILIHGIITS